MDTKVAGVFVLFIGLEILVLSIATAMGLTWETKCRRLNPLSTGKSVQTVCIVAS